MKPNQLAKILGVSPATLRRWAGTEYAVYLSPMGAGKNGARRSFDDTDARILAWIALMRTQNLPPGEITRTLDQAKGQGWKTLPEMPGAVAAGEAVAVMPREAAEERLRAIQEHFEGQLQAVTKERDELRLRLETSDKRSFDLERRINELTVQEAELRGRLQQYALWGKQRSILTLMAIALIAGAVLVLVAIIVGRLLL